MIKAVIFDFGGVITSSPFEAFARFEKEQGLPPDFLRNVNARNHLDNAWARYERADIDLAAFDALFAAETRFAGHEVSGAAVVGLLAGEPRPEMVTALRLLHGRLKIGCITNNLPVGQDDAGAKMASMYKADIMALFDHVVESAKIGLRKPDPRIYAMMTDALGVDPQNCVYLDDLGVNLKPARALGMKTIKVDAPGPAIDALEALVGFSLRASA